MDPSMHKLPTLEEFGAHYEQIVLLSCHRVGEAQRILGIGESKFTDDKKKFNLIGPLPQPIVLPQDLSIEKLLEIVKILRLQRKLGHDPFAAFRAAREEQQRQLQQHPPPPPRPPLPDGRIIW
jgi:hypothetical protein